MSALSLTKKEKAPASESFLKFQLAPNISAVLSAYVVQEAAVLPMRRVMAMPNMPAALLGLINRRGKVLWVANLIRLLGLPVSARTAQQYSLVIVKGQQSSLALQVETIDGIISFPLTAVQPPPANVSPMILPYLQGCVVHMGETVFVLDAESILQSSALQTGD